jgi:hypothetical protein
MVSITGFVLRVFYRNNNNNNNNNNNKKTRGLLLPEKRDSHPFLYVFD